MPCTGIVATFAMFATFLPLISGRTGSRLLPQHLPRPLVVTPMRSSCACVERRLDQLHALGSSTPWRPEKQAHAGVRAPLRVNSAEQRGSRAAQPRSAREAHLGSGTEVVFTEIHTTSHQQGSR